MEVVRTSRLAPRLLAVTASVAISTGCAVTPPELAEPDGRMRSAATIDKRVLRSEAALASIVDPAAPGCSGAVGVRGEVVWAGASGIADLGTGAPVTTQTRFEIASVSKQFTATAILMLQREGSLSLADPVSTYVDGLPAWGRSVTLEQLMHHTARVPDYWTVLDRDGIGFSDAADHARILDAIRRLPRLEPGEGYVYSNSNYVLLAEVVNRVSGLPLPEFLAQRIFDPLGLDMVLAPGLTGDDIPISYDADLNEQPPGWTAYGAIGVVTTAGELVRWGDQYRTGDIIQDDFAVDASDQGTGEFYAAGMDIEVDGDLNHNGRFGGYVSTFTVSADRQTTIAVLCNGQAAPRFPLADALWAIWDPADAAETDGAEG